MSALRFLRRICADEQGGPLVEFAILVPTIFAMLLGVLQVGIQMWNYNSMRAIAADTVRYTVVEYQKANQVTTSQIQSKAVAIAVNVPYNFNINNLTITAAHPNTDISGLQKYTIAMTYTPPNVLGFIGVSAPTLTFNRPIYVS